MRAEPSTEEGRVIALGVLTWRWTPRRGDPAAARPRSRSGATADRQTERQRETVSETWLPPQGCLFPRARRTFSSPAATLKASSMTEPTAMRTAADECISFHTVSLSTCRGQRRESVPPRNTHRPCRQVGGGGGGWGALTPIPPQGSTAYIFWLIGPETANQRLGQRHVT